MKGESELVVNYNALYDEWRLLVELEGEVKSRKRKVRSLMKKAKPLSTLNIKPKDIDKGEKWVELYKQGKTLQEIGDIYGVSREWVRLVLKRQGLTASDGGRSLKSREKRERRCKNDGCESLADGSKGYCKKHYGRTLVYGTPNIIYKNEFQINDGSCLVEGCDQPFKSNGLCNKHRTNFYLNARNGSVSDLNDFLKVQKAKRMMGKSYALFSEIREFMIDNKQYFEEDLYRKEHQNESITSNQSSEPTSFNDSTISRVVWSRHKADQQ